MITNLDLELIIEEVAKHFKCEKCKGTGNIVQETPITIIGLPIGIEAATGVVNCPNCGGSGLKWRENEKQS